MTITDPGASVGDIIRILVVEDFEPYRQVVVAMLDHRPDLQVVASVSNGLEAVEKARELKPNLILMDIGLPGLNGIEAARQICHLSPQSKVVFLTQESSPEIQREAMLLGGWGFVLKSEAESSLLPAIQAVLEGKQFFREL